MCEYSLHAVPNRLAIEGEQLATYRFHTHSIGLASLSELEALRSWYFSFKNWLNPARRSENVTAVCIPDGARLRASHLPKYIRTIFCLGSVEEVTFVQLSAEPDQYRDAIQFRTGRRVLLQYFDEGVRFRVLSLQSAEPQAPEWEPDELWHRSPFDR